MVEPPYFWQNMALTSGQDIDFTAHDQCDQFDSVFDSGSGYSIKLCFFLEKEEEEGTMRAVSVTFQSVHCREVINTHIALTPSKVRGGVGEKIISPYPSAF